MDSNDWLSIATTTADIAVKLLPLFVFADDSQQGVVPEPLPFGPTKWYVINSQAGENIEVENDSSDTIALTFSEALTKGPISTFHVLEPKAVAGIGNDFSAYAAGEFCLSRVGAAEPTMVDGVAVKTIVFTINSLTAAVSYNLITGFSVRLARENGKWQLHLTNKGPEISSGHIRVAADDGKQTVRIEAELSKGKTDPGLAAGNEEQTWEFDLVGSEILDQIALNLYVELTIPSETFDERVRDRLYRATKSS